MAARATGSRSDTCAPELRIQKLPLTTAKEIDVPGPQGGEHVEVFARAQYGAEYDVSGVTIELSYALIQADVVNQLCEIRRQCTANHSEGYAGETFFGTVNGV